MRGCCLGPLLLAALIFPGGLRLNSQTSATGCSTPSFAAPHSFASGALPQFLALGEFNGDRAPDLVITTIAPSRIAILLGNRDGTFRAGPVHQLGEGLQPVAVGDFDGNGKMDLAVVNYGASKVYILLGNGDGTFQNSGSYAVGRGANSVVVADFNGDGRSDLAVPGSDGSMLIGNGDGTFQNAVNLRAGVAPLSLAVDDINGDHIPDLVVVVNSDSGFLGSAGVLLGKGDGTFGELIRVTSSLSSSVATGDLNGDSNSDLAAIQKQGVFVALRNGAKDDDSFLDGRLYDFGQALQAMSIKDFNGDGKPDLALANASSSDGTVMVALGNGDGTFRDAASFAVPGIPYALVVGDFNGDASPDLAMASNTGVVAVLLNLCTSTTQARLAILQDNAGITLSWPASFGNYVLKSTSSLSSPTWQPVPGAAITRGDRLQVIAPISSRQEYFRLSEP